MIREIYALGALLLGMSGLLVGNGLFGTLTALRMTIEDFDPTMIGIVVSAHSVGFVLGCVYGERVVAGVGHIRCFTAFAALMAAFSLALPLYVEPVSWIPIRLGFGFCSAIVFMVAESWLAGGVSAANKGRIFSVYMVINKGSFGLGQLLLQVADPAGDRLFMLVGVLYALCLVPIALARTGAPLEIGSERMSFRALWAHSPVGVFCATATGLANSALVGLSPVFAVQVGFTVGEVATFMTLFMLGSLALQIPIGRLSDRFDRRGVLVGVAVSASAACLATALLAGSGIWPLMAVAVVVGGLSAVTYPIAMAHASDHASSGAVVSIMAGLLLAFGVGASVSAFAASLVMKAVGPEGLYLYAGAVYIVMAAFTAYRMTRRAPVPDAAQADFVAQPQTSLTSPAAAALDPRARQGD